MLTWGHGLLLIYAKHGLMLPKKSFFFSLIATRSFVFQQRPEKVIAIHRSLEQAYHWSEYHHQKNCTTCRLCTTGTCAIYKPVLHIH